MTLYLDKTSYADWVSLVHAFPDKEFQNVTRSSLPLLAYWMGADLDDSLAYHFEYTVPSVSGARSSHTDLMIIGSDEVVAIEGKSTEPRYHTVADWLNTPGRLRRSALDHWISHIEAVTRKAPRAVDVDICVYQMVHRLASVCSIERRTRVLTYQVFQIASRESHYGADLRRLYEVFGLAGEVEVRLNIVETALTAEGKQLGAILPSLEMKERAGLVRRWLLTGRLFKFGDEKTEVIE